MSLRLALALASALAAGCSSSRFSVASSTAPGTCSEVRVLGAEPRVQVRNQGPGDLRVELDSPDDAADVSVQLGRGDFVRTLPGPVVVRLVAVGRREARWRVQAWHTGGLEADLRVEGWTPAGE